MSRPLLILLNVSIFGLGYVGSVAAGCLAAQGCRVIGVDVHPEKITSIKSGRAPIHEPEIDALLGEGIENGLLSATTDVTAAVRDSDVSVICVGTPCDSAGALDLRFVEKVTDEIRAAIGDKEKHSIVFRSTMLPGSTRTIADRFLKDLIDSGRVDVFFFPEFLRQGAAVADYRDPSLSVIGTYRDGQSVDEIAALFVEGTEVTDLETAELLKYACNAFHATKVVFANEIGRVGKQLGIDSRRVMKLLCDDHRLNISSHYLKPGNPFGGSCLPKDVSALGVLASSLGVDVPTLQSLVPSNDRHRDHLRALVEKQGKKEVVIVGLTFKHDTDDLRGSPLLQLAHDLLADGYDLRIFDPLLDPGTMIGASKLLVAEKLPNLAELMRASLADALGQSGTVVASNRCVDVAEIAQHTTDDHQIIDASGWPELSTLSNSQGICW